MWGVMGEGNDGKWNEKWEVNTLFSMKETEKKYTTVTPVIFPFNIGPQFFHSDRTNIKEIQFGVQSWR